MSDITRKDHIARLKASLACEEKRLKGECCIDDRCDNCNLNYDQGNWGEWIDTLRFAIDSLEVDEAYQLEYERVTKKGTWQQTNKNEVNVIPEWKCSECGAEFQCHDMDFEYCPRCGSRMEDSDD